MPVEDREGASMGKKKMVFMEETIRIIGDLNTLKYLCEHAMDCRCGNEIVGMYKVPLQTWQMAAYLQSRVDLRSQRSIKEDNRRRIKEDMESGNYRDYGEPVRIGAERGDLVDGNNRTSAQVLAKVDLPNQWLAILYDPLAHIHIDSNRVPRSVRDCARLIMALDPKNAGKNIPPLEYLVVKAIIAVEYDFVIARTSRVVQAHQVVSSKYVSFVRNRFYDLERNSQVKGSFTGVLAGALACAKVDEEAAAKFFNAIFTNNGGVAGVGAVPVSLGYELIVALRSGDYSSLRVPSSMPKHGQAAINFGADYMIRLWNAWRMGSAYPEEVGLVDSVMAVPV